MSSPLHFSLYHYSRQTEASQKVNQYSETWGILRGKSHQSPMSSTMLCVGCSVRVRGKTFKGYFIPQAPNWSKINKMNKQTATTKQSLKTSCQWARKKSKEEHQWSYTSPVAMFPRPILEGCLIILSLELLQANQSPPKSDCHQVIGIDAKIPSRNL